MSEHFAFPPFRMKKDTAAFYCGMSITSFDRAIEEGELPPGRHRTGGTYWLRQDLEASMVEKTKGNFGQKI